MAISILPQLKPTPEKIKKFLRMILPQDLEKSYPTRLDKFATSISDSIRRAGILRVTPDGNPVGSGILGNQYPLNIYFAYGIRNSFGLDWNTVTGNLWDTEYGPHYGDEINLVEPGFNSITFFIANPMTNPMTPPDPTENNVGELLSILNLHKSWTY
jgi:hypothetical protein